MIRRAALAITIAAALVVGAAPAGAKPPKTTTTTTTPPLPTFDTTLSWADCGDGFQCATLNVPVDWANPPASRWASR